MALIKIGGIKLKAIDLTEEKFTKISGFLLSGYRDYLAARTLINNGLLYRGVIVSATAIEKLLKVFLVLNANPKRTHDVSKLFKEAVKFDAELEHKFNQDFLDFLSKAYRLRYFDDNIFNHSNGKFKLSVPQYKTLAELDFTTLTILNSIKVEYQGQILHHEYHDHLEEENKLLFEKNYLLTGINKKDFIEQKQYVYQIRTIEEGFVERTFQSLDAKDDGVFIFEDER